MNYSTSGSYINNLHSFVAARCGVVVVGSAGNRQRSVVDALKLQQPRFQGDILGDVTSK